MSYVSSYGGNLEAEVELVRFIPPILCMLVGVRSMALCNRERVRSS